MKIQERWEENRDVVIHSYGQMFNMFRRISKLEFPESLDLIRKDRDILVMYVAKEYDFDEKTAEWDIYQGTIVTLHVTELQNMEYKAFVKVTPIIDGLESVDNSTIHHVLNDNESDIHHCSPEFMFMNFIFCLQDNSVIDRKIFI